MTSSSRTGLKHLSLLVIAALGLSAGVAAAEDPYPNVWLDEANLPVKEAWYQQCMAVAKLQPPVSDLPEPARAAELRKQKCDAQDLYYGAQAGSASPSVWTDVRHCAFATQEPAVLMMLYANGLGVPRNKPQSIHYACRTPSAQAETAGRVPHLAGLKPGESFDQCDDITSGAMMGMCSAVHEKQENKARQQRKAQLAKDFSPDEKTAFKALDVAVQRYAKLRGDRETDLSGTARGAMSTDASAQVLDEFLKDLEAFEKGHWEVASEAQWTTEDERLNAAYRQAMKANQHPAPAPGEVSPQGIQATQRAWLVYRDAWVAFARTRYQLVKPWVVSTMLTKRRTQLLLEMGQN